jgi:hypothetical protein
MTERIPVKETKMDSKNSMPEESPATLMEKAADCLEIAQAQHQAADQQHLNADKLEELGYALEVSAVELEGKMLIDARSGPVAPGSTPSALIEFRPRN